MENKFIYFYKSFTYVLHQLPIDESQKEMNRIAPIIRERESTNNCDSSVEHNPCHLYIHTYIHTYILHKKKGIKM